MDKETFQQLLAKAEQMYDAWEAPTAREVLGVVLGLMHELELPEHPRDQHDSGKERK